MPDTRILPLYVIKPGLQQLLHCLYGEASLILQLGEKWN